VGFGLSVTWTFDVHLAPFLAWPVFVLFIKL